MLAVPKSHCIDSPSDLINRTAEVPGVNIIESSEPDDDNPGLIRLQYEGYEYEVRYFTDSFSLPDIEMCRKSYFTEDERQAIADSHTALTVFLNFGPDNGVSYHLQLKIMLAMVPDMLALVDESAERLINGRWVTLAAQSSVTPCADNLFIVHAVANDSDS